LVTDSGLYNLKGAKIKRRIDISEIAGVTVSTRGDEFVVHCPNEYDYRFNASKKSEILHCINIAYEKH